MRAESVLAVAGTADRRGCAPRSQYRVQARCRGQGAASGVRRLDTAAGSRIGGYTGRDSLLRQVDRPLDVIRALHIREGRRIHGHPRKFALTRVQLVCGATVGHDLTKVVLH